MKEEALDRTIWRNRLEEALDLSFDRLVMMMMMMIMIHNGVLVVTGKFLDLCEADTLRLLTSVFVQYGNKRAGQNEIWSYSYIISSKKST